MKMVSSNLMILSTLLCVAYAHPATYEKDVPVGKDLNTARTIGLLSRNRRGGYNGWGTRIQSNPAVANPPYITGDPTSYGTYPVYGTYGNNYFGNKYPSIYPGYVSGSVGSVGGAVGSAYPGYVSGSVGSVGGAVGSAYPGYVGLGAVGSAYPGYVSGFPTHHQNCPHRGQNLENYEQQQ